MWGRATTYRRAPGFGQSRVRLRRPTDRDGAAVKLADANVPQQVPGRSKAPGTGEQPAGFVRRLRAEAQPRQLVADLRPREPVAGRPHRRRRARRARDAAAHRRRRRRDQHRDPRRPARQGARARSSATSTRCSPRCAASMLDILRPSRSRWSIDRTTAPVRDARRRRERLRARPRRSASSRGGCRTQGLQGDARRRRHVPRRRRRAAAGLGRAQRRAGDRAGGGRGSRRPSSSTRCRPRRRAASTC